VNDGTSLLRISIDDDEAMYVDLRNSLAELIASPTAFFGWTAATGRSRGRHEILSFKYLSEGL
jgi:hypothetical protein